MKSGGRDVDHNFVNLVSYHGPDKGGQITVRHFEKLDSVGGGGWPACVRLCSSACLSCTNDG